MSEDREPLTFDAQGGIVKPTRRRGTPKIDLNNATAIRRELAAVYRDMRAGRIESQEGTRLAYVLNMLRQAYETQVIEDRLTALESGVTETRRLK